MQALEQSDEASKIWKGLFLKAFLLLDLMLSL